MGLLAYARKEGSTMIFGSTKSKLDHIIEQGFKRIDEAVEGVIAKHCGHQDTASYVNALNDGIRRTTEALTPLVEANRQAEREYNFRISAMVQRAALAPRQWDAHDIAMQSYDIAIDTGPSQGAAFKGSNLI
jgi:hypothetical protein